MHSHHIIRLSGPFSAIDTAGRIWEFEGIRIFDEGYGVIDVYVDLIISMQDEALYDDALVIAQILSRLRAVGYVGPDFGPGDIGMQDDKLIVLEAPEAFADFAASKGWKNLAEDYAGDAMPTSADILADPFSSAVFAALMQRLRVV